MKNSCASCCCPMRNVLFICRRCLTIPSGRIALLGLVSARPTWSSSRRMASNPGWGAVLRPYPPAAKGGGGREKERERDRDRDRDRDRERERERQRERETERGADRRAHTYKKKRVMSWRSRLQGNERHGAGSNCWGSQSPMQDSGGRRSRQLVPKREGEGASVLTQAMIGKSGRVGKTLSPDKAKQNTMPRFVKQ